MRAVIKGALIGAVLWLLWDRVRVPEPEELYYSDLADLMSRYIVKGYEEHETSDTAAR